MSQGKNSSRDDILVLNGEPGGYRERSRVNMMVCDGGGGKEKVWSSGGSSFQRRGAVMDTCMAWLENMR